MEESTANGDLKSADIRNEFDKILMRHISGLIDTREDIAALPFNLATIACLLLLAERENEIKAFPESPPNRYNRETLFNDLEDIGIDLDEEVLVAIQNLDQYGFVVVNAKEQYTARESASLLIIVLDSILPQMPGMNLVAYVSQAIEEVLTGRKKKEHALQQFDQTLEKQGVRLSALPKNRVPDSPVDRVVIPDRPDPAVLSERRTAYLQKLKALRDKSLQTSSDPAIVGVNKLSRKFEIQELFPKKSKEPAIEPTTEIPPPIETETLIDEVSLPDDVAPPSLSPPEETPSVMDPAPVPDGSDLVLSEPDPEPETKPEQESIHELSPDMPQEADLLEESNIVAPAPESDTEDNLTIEDQIENKIRLFEQELAMPCPICHVGKVLSDTTEKGKTYYYCSNEECKLISWGKPYHMECPLCKNPFLVETTDPDGNISLKCPRATCLYRKKSTAEEITNEINGTRKKKVAVVKKKRGKRGVRRVVRRKS